MGTCHNSLCNNPGVVDKVLEAPFNIMSTSSESKQTIKICTACHEQEKRLQIE